MERDRALSTEHVDRVIIEHRRSRIAKREHLIPVPPTRRYEIMQMMFVGSWDPSES